MIHSLKISFFVCAVFPLLGEKAASPKSFVDGFAGPGWVSLGEKDFAQGFTEHLIEYGLGRPFGFTDLNLADSIMAQAKKEDYAMREFVHALAQSKAFRLK